MTQKNPQEKVDVLVADLKAFCGVDVSEELYQMFKQQLGSAALVMPNGKVYGEKYGGCFIPLKRVEPMPVKITAIVKYEGDDDS